MKKTFILFITLCAIGLSLSIALYAEQIPVKGYVSPDIGLNVRSGPSESNTILGALTQGTTITIVAVSGGWYKISSPMSGYVHAGYVAVTEYGEAPEGKEGEEEEGEEAKTDDESVFTPDEVDKIGCDINRSLKNAKVTKAPPHNP